MKHAALAALLLVLVPLQAVALDVEELLGIVAMPLAVAAVSEVSGVPADQLSHLVATLNRADVPPAQVIQVVRYAPAAFVTHDQQPEFVAYVDQQVDQGVTGQRLVTVIEDRYRTYDLEPQFVAFNEPATDFVVRETYIPETVITRVSTVQPAISDENDLLAWIALPLAVSAASEITGVSANDLASLVATLNGASVPPMQIIEVVRYAPVALVGDPQFVTYLRTQADSGVTGAGMIEVIGQRLEPFDVDPQFVVTRPAVIDDSFIPPIVRTRVAEARAHPHGGPPGQLKKAAGVQTGAEIVHGEHRGRSRAARRDDDDRDGERRAAKVKPPKKKERAVTQERRREPEVRVVERSVPRVERVRVDSPGSSGKGRGHDDANRGKDKDKGHGNGGNPGNQGGGNGKGKGKG